ncbi:cbb3-type cytochrome oxidase assembly protein [Pimelobacter sp. 30-1]|uniref:cbb3-type cytochrome oxidase assembly protein n=1 Tax=Pimelobacter sp. 30-1 TaxID=2004991 RepID=UPI001C049916|nr:hypothetical protein [Pimelobacter sp. 30-1]MBU2697003.1 hypothetical protein [Pimelobacter sp. 30-1]
MEILFWLLPAAVLTVASMAWVAWWGREGRGEVDRETAARRMGEALAREQRVRPGYAAPRREAERATGIALRTSRRRPVVIQGETPAAPVAQAAEQPGVQPDEQSRRDDAAGTDRRAS